MRAEPSPPPQPLSGAPERRPRRGLSDLAPEGGSGGPEQAVPAPSCENDTILTCPAVSQSWSLTGRPSTETTAEMTVGGRGDLLAPLQRILPILAPNPSVPVPGPPARSTRTRRTQGGPSAGVQHPQGPTVHPEPLNPSMAPQQGPHLPPRWENLFSRHTSFKKPKNDPGVRETSGIQPAALNQSEKQLFSLGKRSGPSGFIVKP